MIRPLSFVILLSASAIVLAQPLYKWVEPDGSITFAVTPPPAGVEYETVNGSKPADSANLKAASAARSQMAPGVQEASRQATQPELTSQPPTQRIAPQLGTQTTLRQGIQRSSSEQLNTHTNQRLSSARSSNNVTGIAQGDNQRIASLANKTRKQRQCEDLKKRVVSLEGRLRNRLTPEDMDNTVVHMARYQLSYDKHCVQ